MPGQRARRRHGFPDLFSVVSRAGGDPRGARPFRPPTGEVYYVVSVIQITRTGRSGTVRTNSLSY